MKTAKTLGFAGSVPECLSPNVLAPEKRLQMKKSTTKKKGCENKF